MHTLSLVVACMLLCMINVLHTLTCIIIVHRFRCHGNVHLNNDSKSNRGLVRDAESH